MDDLNIKSFVFIFTLALMANGCAVSRVSSTAQRLGPDTIVEQLAEENPGGVPVSIATTRMESEGFTVDYVANGEFTHEIRNETPTLDRRKYENIEFLKCRRKSQSGLVSYVDTRGSHHRGWNGRGCAGELVCRRAVTSATRQVPATKRTQERFITRSL